MQWDILSGIVEEQKKSGVDIEMISAEEARKITPQLSKDIYGALYSPTGGKVNPIKLTLGFARAAKKLGATIQIETEVTGIIMEGNAVKGVHTTKGDYFADTIVNACGSWAAFTAKMDGLDMPIKPEKGTAHRHRAHWPLHGRHAAVCPYNVIKFRPETIKDEKLLGGVLFD